MKQFIDTNIAALVDDFTKLFISSVQELASQDVITVGLSGGSSVNHFYANMENIFSELGDELIKKIHFCFLDERVVAFSDPDSNYFGLKQSLLQSLIDSGYIDESQLLLPDFSLENFAEEYFDRVEKIDIGLFGVGPDGHTCSLFPHHELLEDQSTGYLEITDSPKTPAHRITISKSMLEDTKFAYVFFMGESKREAYTNFVDADVSIQECPAKLMQNCGETYVFSNQVV